MQISKPVLKYAEFYITHVCNFNCDGCSRFNNYTFSGTQRWNDYKEQIVSWASKVDIKRFSIMGGEPLTNPDCVIWFKNISELWPNSQGWIHTNAHYLKINDNDLYDVLSSRPNLGLRISSHNPNNTDRIIDRIKNFLKQPITIKRIPENLADLPGFFNNWQASYQKIKADWWPNCDSPEDWHKLPSLIKKECEEVFSFSPDLIGDKIREFVFVDRNGVRINLKIYHNFHQAAARLRNDDTFDLYNSDPVRAHNMCDAKLCHTFFKGKLYKCFLPAVLPDFNEQFTVNMSCEDKRLLDSYVPLNASDGDTIIQNFIDNIENPIPQCKFCPENYITKVLEAEHGKKIKIIKKHSRKEIKYAMD